MLKDEFQMHGNFGPLKRINNQLAVNSLCLCSASFRVLLFLSNVILSYLEKAKLECEEIFSNDFKIILKNRWMRMRMKQRISI